RLGLTIGTGDGAGIQVVASDDDRSPELTASHHLVEGQAQAVPVPEAHPADACRQSLEVDALARHVQPMMQMPILRQELTHFGVGPVDVLGIARQRGPAERTDAAAEQRPDVSRNEARESKGVLDAGVEGPLPQVVAVVEYGNSP